MKTLLAVLFMTTLSSCIFDYYDDTDGNDNRFDPDGYLMVLRINPLDRTSAAADGQRVSEMVKSLRIIVLSDGAVEFNRYISVGESAQGINMADLNYVFTARTVEGSKSFYLFANEESVGEMKFFSDGSQADGSQADGDSAGSLHDYLESVVPDVNDAAAGQAFERIVNSVYFTPEYTTDASGNIYLPYTAYYDGYTVGVDNPANQDNALQMFLVPVATKFVFRFVNYRPNEVEINNISVSSTNLDNFLLARVNAPDYTKAFDGTDYYWVNWLAKVSEASHAYGDYSGNMTFNEIYGWISHYDMPAIDEKQTSEFVSAADNKSVAAGVTDPESEEITPSVLTLGPFYVPESWNSYTYEDETTGENVTVQRYGLTLGIHDVTSSPGRDPVFEDVAIDNLKALFRNTCVLVKVNMSAGKVEVYAEINPWNIKTAYGWLTEGNAPADNPFDK